MTLQLDVTLHDRLVGTLTNLADDLNVVAIDDDYRNDPDAPVISFKAFRDPITGRYREAIRPTRTRVHPYFANLLPEGPLRNYLAQHAHVKPVRDFPLLWLLGLDLPGALVLRDHDGAALPPHDGDHHDEQHDSNADLLRFSLAGVQLKFSATGTPNRGLTIPAGGQGGNWIVKLPDQRFTRVPENEFSMMTFARAVGIEVPEIGLVDPDDVVGLPSDIRNVTGQAFYIRRFDRTGDGGRVHTEDFAQANMIYPEQKYDHFNFDMLAQQIAELMGTDRALDFIRRLVFSIGIGNGDMHAKNWSLIYYDGRTPSLAPAYDYVSTVVYMPNDNLGMNLHGTKLFSEIGYDLMTAFADRARLPRRPVISAVTETVDRMHDVWPALRGELPMEPSHLDAVEAHINAVPLFAPRTATARK